MTPRAVALTHVVHPPYLAGTGNDTLTLLGAAAVVIPIAGAALVLLIGGLLEGLGVKTSFDEVSQYFREVGEPAIKVQVFVPES